MTDKERKALQGALEYIDGDEPDGNCPLCGGGPESGLPYHKECPCKAIREVLAEQA